MSPSSWAETIYRKISRTVWASPVARNLFVANMLIRLGRLGRRWLRLAPRGERVALVQGSKMRFAPDSECYLDMKQGRYEPEVTRLFERLLKPGMVVVDGGAHTGYFGLLAAQKVGPTGRVYAFEPAPANYTLLVENIALNGYQNIVPVQKAVSNKSGTAKFFLRPDSVGHSLHPATLARGEAVVTVETTSLDDFFEAEGWPSVHLVKLDIEGAEPAAVEGMSGLLARNRDLRLIFEFAPRILERVGGEPYGFLRRIRSLGFSIQMTTEKNGLQPFDDELVGKPSFQTELYCEKNGL